MIINKQKNAPSSLHQHFDFTDEDLAANAQGHITARQYQRLQRIERREWRQIVAFGTVFGVLALVSLIIVIATIVTRKMDSTVCACVFIPIGVLISWGARKGADERWEHMQQIHREGHAQKITGPVHVYVRRVGRGNVRYELSIRNTTFEIPKKALLALKNGAIYDLYMIQATRRILSLQLVGPETPLMSVRNLYATLGMQPEDLSVNRQGRLSVSQRHRLREEGMLGCGILALTVVLLSCFGLLIVFGSKDPASVLRVFVVLMLICVALVMRPVVDAWRGKVLIKEGMPLRESATIRQDRLIIKDKTFRVSTDVLLVFNPDAVYRVYYTPLSNTIVAAERVDRA